MSFNRSITFWAVASEILHNLQSRKSSLSKTYVPAAQSFFNFAPWCRDRWKFKELSVFQLHIMGEQYFARFEFKFSSWGICYTPTNPGPVKSKVIHSTYRFSTNLSWWRHQMETFSALLAFCAGNWRGALMFFFDLRLNKPLSKQSRDWWFETSSCPLWRHCNIMKQSWRIQVNESIDLINNSKIGTTKQSMTKPCESFMG